jgi:hypothetical protein
LLTSGETVFLSLRAIKDAHQVLHHQIAYEKTVEAKGKKEQRPGHALCALLMITNAGWLALGVTHIKSLSVALMEVMVDETAWRIM